MILPRGRRIEAPKTAPLQEYRGKRTDDRRPGQFKLVSRCAPDASWHPFGLVTEFAVIKDPTSSALRVPNTMAGRGSWGSLGHVARELPQWGRIITGFSRLPLPFSNALWQWRIVLLWPTPALYACHSSVVRLNNGALRNRVRNFEEVRQIAIATSRSVRAPQRRVLVGLERYLS